MFSIYSWGKTIFLHQISIVQPERTGMLENRVHAVRLEHKTIWLPSSGFEFRTSKNLEVKFDLNIGGKLIHLIS